MLKAAVLVGFPEKGSPISVADITSSSLIEQAQNARVTGILNGERIVAGMVLSSWTSSPMYKFRCDKIAAEVKKGKPKK